MLRMAKKDIRNLHFLFIKIIYSTHINVCYSIWCEMLPPQIIDYLTKSQELSMKNQY